jgi:general secretion pathway protein A
MILDYYKLNEAPFGDTPDPRFLYMGDHHREALASLLVGTESNRGFMAVIAQPGMGKTSLIYEYLGRMSEKARTAFIFQTDCDSREFIRHILMDLGIDAAGKDLPAMHEMLNKVLAEEMKNGRRFILVIDEAQNLEEKTLESVRLLSNFETPWTKLMQIILVGQPQLARRLNKPSMLQLRQRLSMIIRLEPLNFEETRNYIQHRLTQAGYQGPSLFTMAAQRLIAERSQGIPRNINTICFNAMTLSCAMRQATIDHNVVLEVLADLDINSLESDPNATHAKDLKLKLSQATATAALKDEKHGLRGLLTRLAAASALLMLLLVAPFAINKQEWRHGGNDVSKNIPVVTSPTKESQPTPADAHSGEPLGVVAHEQVDRP